MLVGMAEATGELIAFCDSDVRTDAGALTHAVETLLELPRTGSAFSPVVVTSPPKTFGDAGYALMLNALYGPVTAAVAKRNGDELPFIMGQFMVLTRYAIDKIGGLEAAEGQLVDDMYLGARMRAVGLHNRVSPHPVSIIQEGLTMGEFWIVYIRWITFSRSGLPGWGFRVHAAAPVALYWASLILAVVALTQGWWLAAAVNAMVPLTVTWIYDKLHRVMGGARLGPLNRWASLMVLLMAPIVLPAVYSRREVAWRGHTYSLDGSAKLRTDQDSGSSGVL